MQRTRRFRSLACAHKGCAECFLRRSGLHTFVGQSTSCARPSVSRRGQIMHGVSCDCSREGSEHPLTCVVVDGLYVSPPGVLTAGTGLVAGAFWISSTELKAVGVQKCS